MANDYDYIETYGIGEMPTPIVGVTLKARTGAILRKVIPVAITAGYINTATGNVFMKTPVVEGALVRANHGVVSFKALIAKVYGAGSGNINIIHVADDNHPVIVTPTPTPVYLPPAFEVEGLGIVGVLGSSALRLKVKIADGYSAVSVTAYAATSFGNIKTSAQAARGVIAAGNMFFTGIKPSGLSGLEVEARFSNMLTSATGKTGVSCSGIAFLRKMKADAAQIDQKFGAGVAAFKRMSVSSGQEYDESMSCSGAAAFPFISCAATGLSGIGGSGAISGIISVFGEGKYGQRVSVETDLYALYSEGRANVSIVGFGEVYFSPIAGGIGDSNLGADPYILRYYS